MGAYVISPEQTILSNVAAFDFASLYPSILISYNIAYNNYVKFEIM